MFVFVCVCVCVCGGGSYGTYKRQGMPWRASEHTCASSVCSAANGMLSGLIESVCGTLSIHSATVHSDARRSGSPNSYTLDHPSGAYLDVGEVDTREDVGKNHFVQSM
jgi:hypothetical protein